MIRVRTLGQCVIEIDGVKVGPDAEIVFAALLLLTLESRRPLARSEIIRLLWPDAEPARAAHCLRQTIYRIRSLGAAVRADRTTVSIAHGEVEVDADALELERGNNAVELLLATSIEAFLPGYAPTFSDSFTEWLDRQRDRVHSKIRRVILECVGDCKARGDWTIVERLARVCLAIDPLNEEGTLALAESIALNGSKAAALKLLEDYLLEIKSTNERFLAPVTALRDRISEVGRTWTLDAGVSTRCIGRSAQLGILSAAYNQAAMGKGSTFLVHGEPGIGKTHMLREFQRARELEGARVLEFCCQPSDSRRPLSAFVDLLPTLRTLPGALGCSPESHEYIRRLTDHAFADVLRSQDAGSSELVFAGVRRVLLDLVDAIASESMLVLVIEDGQWLDGASWEIVLDLAVASMTRQLLVVVSQRGSTVPMANSDSPGATYLRILKIGPLEAEARLQLFDAIVTQRRRTVSRQFRQWCADTSGGNPYFLLELAHHATEGGAMFAVPPSLTALVSQRVSQLGQVSHRILQSCAILGKNATVSRVEAMLNQPRMLLMDGFDELEVAGLLEHRGGSLIVQHELLSQAATLRASEATRRLLHGQAAQLLSDEFARTRAHSTAWDCAEHWIMAGEPAEAVHAAIRCARYFIQIGRPEEAVDLLQRLRERCGPSGALDEILSELAHALRAAERWLDLSHALEELASLPNQSPEQRARLKLERLESQWNVGIASPTLIDNLIEACESSTSDATLRLRVATGGLIASDNFCLPQAVQRIERMVRPLVDTHASLLVSKDYDIIYHCSYGDIARAEQIATGLVSELRRNSNEPLLCKYLLRSAHVFEVAGHYAQSIAAAQEAYTLAESYALTSSACLASRWLAWAHLARLEIEKAEAWTARGEEWGRQTQYPPSVADIATLHAELAFIRGDLNAAARLLDESNAKWARFKHPRCEGHAHAFKIAMATDRGLALHAKDFDECVRLYEILANRTMADMVVARFAMACSASGREELGRWMLKDYLGVRRREKGSVHPFSERLFERARALAGVFAYDLAKERCVNT